MKVSKKILLFLLIYPAFLSIQGQTLKNIKAETIGERVVITYDLEAPQRDQQFDVKIFASHDNYSNPLRFVSGDVGESVLPGRNRRVEWDATSELQSFDGNITFEVRATIVMSAVTFKNPTRGTKFKRGKTYQIVWEGAASNKEYQLQLIHSGVVVQTIGTVENTNRFTWSIPKRIDNGRNFSLRLADGNKNIAESQTFKIKRKTPLALKIVPIVAVGVGVAIYFLNAEDPVDPPKPPVVPVEPDPLPGPPDTPEG